MSSLEEILQVHREPNEDWGSVFKRLDSYGGLDFKTLTKVVIYLLEEYERIKDRQLNTSDTGSILDRAYESLQEGVGGVDEEVQPNPESTGDNSDSGSTQESEPVIA